MAVRAKQALGQHCLNDLEIAKKIAGSIETPSLPESAKKWGELPVLEVDKMEEFKQEAQEEVQLRLDL